MQYNFYRTTFILVCFLSFFFIGQTLSAQSTDPSPYCYPAAVKMTSGTCTGSGGNDGYRFSSVEISSIVSVSDSTCYGSGNTDVYRRWNSAIQPLMAGMTYTLEVRSPWRSGNDTFVLSAWIDIDLDNDFDVGELIVKAFSTTKLNWISAFKIPFGTPEGKSRIRVMIQQGTALNDPCSIASGYGETWDLDVNIIRDTKSPVISFLGGNPFTYIPLDCSQPFLDTFVMISDETDPMPQVIVKGNVDRTRAGTYFVNYQGLDASGNYSVPTTRAFVVVPTDPAVKDYYKREFSGTQSLFIANKFSSAVTGTKWYVDQAYQAGMDNEDTFRYTFNDTLQHFVCIETAYCGDTSSTFCGSNLGKPYGLTGKIFQDKDQDCEPDPSESGIKYVRLNLYDKNGGFLYSTYTDTNGQWSFDEYFGKFKVKIDTSELPLSLHCKAMLDSLIELIPAQPLVKDLDFGMTCKDPDLSVKSIIPLGWVFPGEKHLLDVKAGNLLWNTHIYCPSNTGGQVKITVTGKVKYLGKGLTGISPTSVSGNVYTYQVKNFDSAFYRAFQLRFLTDTNATTGDSISVLAEIIPQGSDAISSNNKIRFCYYVRNSYDPNVKEVYPVNVPPAYDGWLTYTVHFQNTGNAPAFNISIRDTLDELLDPETFQVLAFSHDVRPTLNKRAISFLFKDIMLPDSFSDEQGSHGFVQYSIKPKAGLKKGDEIKNTAFIYFDYNEAVVTNTTINTVEEPVSSITPVKQNGINIYPNPGTGLYRLSFPNEVDITNLRVEVYNVMGELIYEGNAGIITQIDLSNQASGIYLVRVNGRDLVLNACLLKQ